MIPNKVKDYTKDEIKDEYPNQTISYEIGDYNHLATNETTGFWFIALDTHRLLYRGPYRERKAAERAWLNKWRVS